MGCFLGCFGSSRRNKNNREERNPPLQLLEKVRIPTVPIKAVAAQHVNNEKREKEKEIPSPVREIPDRNQVNNKNEEEEEEEEEEPEKLDKFEEGWKEYKTETSLVWSDLTEMVKPETDITLEESKGKKIRDRSWFLSDVMSPVENLTQWNAVKSKEIQDPVREEEDRKMENNDEGGGRQISDLTTSLSTWLSSPTESTTPMSKSSYKSSGFEDRPILGALTLEEIRQFSSANSTPRIRASPPTPDEMPIVGSMGAYWGKACDGVADSTSSPSSFMGIPNTNSKYREDQKVKWHTTPFEMRLERALKSGVAEA